MKNVIRIGGFIAMLSLASCSDFLDREPLDQLTTSKFYNSPEEANLATISMYSAIQNVNWYGKSWMITEIPSDNTTSGGNDPDFSPIDNFTMSADNVPNAEFWSEHFKLVSMANQVIANIPGVKMDAKIKQSYVAEARFLRAFSYFDLVRIYGAVPIIKEVPTIATDLKVKRDKVEDVYNLIREDLEFAIINLPSTRTAADMGRATNIAAKALLGKVALTTKDYDKAQVLYRDIIASKQFRLMDDFGQNFYKETSDNNAESIFQVQYVGCGNVGTGNALQAFFAPWGQGITGNSDGWGSQIPTSPAVDNPGTTLKDIYAKEDLRRYHTFMSPGDIYPQINPEKGGYKYPAAGSSRAGISIKKYVIGGGPDVCFMTSPQNVHVIRYADVLLGLAEAATAKNGGLSTTPDVLESYNAVRKRAGLLPEAVVSIEKVFEERRREFAFENQRWFDLLRTGNVQKTMQLHGKQMQLFNVLFPIPSQELAINSNLTQNPGYN